MDDSKRYSQKRLEESFAVYVLLSEPLQFSVSEILSALREDYPSLSWSGDILGGSVIDTASFGVGVLWPQESEQRKPSPVNFIATPGRCDVAWDDILHKSRFAFPQGKAAVDRHVSCLSISVRSYDTSLPARFDAARRMTCIGAIFARLPICTSIYYPGADLVLPPKFWIDAADTASRDGVPVLQWINFATVALPDQKQPTPMTTSSIGLAAFLGCEVALLLARIPPRDAVQYVYSACVMLLERGHRFRDSDTFGLEGSSEKLRIRFLGEGVCGMQTDVWALLHPTFPLDEEQMFGPRLRAPAPPGIDTNRRGEDGWLKQKLTGFFART